MTEPTENKSPKYPFTAFNFRVELTVPGLPATNGQSQERARFVCDAAFSECDGLEMTLEPKTIREGGNNGRSIHLIGPESYGQLTLKRGMTDNLDLWTWFDEVMQRGRGGLRASGQIFMLSGDQTEQAVFNLEGCLPIKLKAPALKAADGLVAIEEMQIAYERLRRQQPEGTGG